MKFPSLVKKQFCKTPVEITIYGEGITEDGSPVVAFHCGEIYPSDTLLPNTNLFAGNAHCNMQSKAKTIYTKEQKIVQVSAVLLFSGDLALDCPNLSSGYVVLDGEKRTIVQGIKQFMAN